MSKLKQFLLGRNVSGPNAGSVATFTTMAMLGAWILYDVRDLVVRSGRTHNSWQLSKGMGDVAFIAVGIGTALAGIRFATGKRQTQAGILLLIWHFVSIFYLYHLFTILRRFRDVVAYWEWAYS